jgi:hypothetical protein
MPLTHMYHAGAVARAHQQVSEEVRAQAKAMAREALAQRLREISMTPQQQEMCVRSAMYELFVRGGGGGGGGKEG